jgi:hypothetical protein
VILVFRATLSRCYPVMCAPLSLLVKFNTKLGFYLVSLGTEYALYFALRETISNQATICTGILLVCLHPIHCFRRSEASNSEWEAYTVHQASSTLKHVKRSLTLPWIPYVGVLGMPGKTAFYGYKAFADAKKVSVCFLSAYRSLNTTFQGETIFVSSAAGAVGS